MLINALFDVWTTSAFSLPQAIPRQLLEEWLKGFEARSEPSCNAQVLRVFCDKKLGLGILNEIWGSAFK